MYIRIIEKELDEMSDREYDYYQKIDKECKEFLRVQKYLEDDDKYIETDMDNVTSVTTNEPELEEKLYALYEGPRFGVTYVAGDLPESLTIPLLFQFGWQFERRIFGDVGQSIGLIEFIQTINNLLFIFQAKAS